MFNLKAGGVAAAMAFLLSFLIGLVNRTGMPMLIVRPLIFAVIFFVVSEVIYILVRRFLPELLSSGMDRETSFPLGSKVDITEGDFAGFTHGEFSGAPPPAGGQVFMGAQADDSEEGLGDIADLQRKIGQPSVKGMDQDAKSGYNEEGSLEGMPEPQPFTPWDPLSPLGGKDAGGEPWPIQAPAPGAVQTKPAAVDVSGSAGSGDFFPDLDSMAGAFTPASAGQAQDTVEYSAPAPSKKPSRSNKASQWPEDFSAKDIAARLRTVLSKDKEG
ncbi:MAG: hypothetical protein FWC64_05820 [Treponema sp.]|nr:hypothetical protein [Treponema sp.]